MNELKRKLTEAEKAQALMHQELDKVSGELERLDLNSGDLDKTVDAQIRLTAKRDILAKRLELAGEAVKTLQGDILLASEAKLSSQLAAGTAQLEAAKATARVEILALIRGGELSSRQQADVHAVVLLHRKVVLLLTEHERITARHREALGECSDVRRKRAQAESAAADQIHKDVFEGRI